MKKIASRFVCAVLLLALVSCATLHRQPNANGTPGAPPTSLETVNYNNAQIAIHNRAIAKAIIAVNQAGFLEPAYFDSLSAAQIKVTRIHELLTPLLKNPTPADGPAIRALLGQLQQITSDMVNIGNVGIKNDQSKAAALNDIRAISSLGGVILSTLVTAGVIK